RGGCLAAPPPLAAFSWFAVHKGRFGKPSYLFLDVGFSLARASVSATSSHSWCHACRSVLGSLAIASGSRKPAKLGSVSQRRRAVLTVAAERGLPSCLSSKPPQTSRSARSQSRAWRRRRARSWSSSLSASLLLLQPASAAARAAAKRRGL